MNELNIIALIGPDSCGKTTTLNIVYQELLRLGAISTNREQEGGNPNDFSDILIWQELRVAFFTMGDYSNAIVNSFLVYNNENCNFLVCAINDRFVRPFRAITDFPNTQIRKVREQIPQERQQANIEIANQIINLIQ